jgi:Flp pilus assembly protein TadD
VREAVRLDPNDDSAHCGLALVLENKGDLDAGITELRIALRLNPKNAMAHYRLGIGLTAKGGRREALPEFRRACELEPNNPTFRQGLERALKEGSK